MFVIKSTKGGTLCDVEGSDPYVNEHIRFKRGTKRKRKWFGVRILNSNHLSVDQLFPQILKFSNKTKGKDP